MAVTLNFTELRESCLKVTVTVGLRFGLLGLGYGLVNPLCQSPYKGRSISVCKMKKKKEMLHYVKSDYTLTTQPSCTASAC